MIGARRYSPSSLVTPAMACVCESWLHKSSRLDWSRPQWLASVNRGYVYDATIYINRSVFIGHAGNGLRP